jgi:hypothetical protein
MTMKLMTAIAIGGFVVVSSSAWAAQGAPSGQNVLTCEVKTMTLDEGHSFTIGNWKGLVVTVPDSPDHMAHIDCLGTFESMADKSFKASGYCVITDRDGDKMLDRWWADSTMPKGRWEDTGISGKWKGFRQTGSYVYTDRSTPSECRGFSNWEADR